MGLKSNYQYLKEWGINNRQNLTTGAFLALGFLIGLGIGLLVGTQKPSPIIIDKNVKVSLPGRQMEFSKNPEKTFNLLGSNFVASINGKAYYPKGCPSANVIKEENRVWFNSVQEAELQGYAPAKNCSW